MVVLYSIFIRVYVLAVRIAALWNGKAKAWIEGRKNLFPHLEASLPPGTPLIWMHCSSAGEFEQGKPLAEALKAQYPDHKLLLSFFSPSGYAVARGYPHADLITYLPPDTRAGARRFMEVVNPRLAVFIKYEFWHHHLSAAAARNIPLLLVSAVFRPDQVFFRWYGTFLKKILFLFRHIFVQDAASLAQLQQAGVQHASISGDTRFDRVLEVAGRFTEIPGIPEFIGGDRVMVAGSTWGDDEQLLAAPLSLKLILAPHEINEAHLQQIEKLFPEAVRYSRLQHPTTAQVLIIDNVGMLSRLYRYATLTYIGGGFTRDGIHNILEAAVYGKPVLFGPNYEKYREARELIKAGGAFSISNAAELKESMETLLQATGERAGSIAREYIEQNRGATGTVLRFIQANRLLTI